MEPSVSKTQPSARWPIIAPLGVGSLLTLLTLLWMPWERVHPNDASLREAIGYAPIWSHRYGSVPGAHIDWRSFLINLLVIWVICSAAAMMLAMSNKHD